MKLFIDTCVLPRSHMEAASLYTEKFGSKLGFELLPMFDLPDFEENLKANLSLFMDRPLFFHEPVWGVDHAAPKGSRAYEEGMRHILLTKKYAEILHPTDMVYHLNNSIVPPEHRDDMLKTSLENLDEMRHLFPDTRLLVENTGIEVLRDRLLDQSEFTDMCRDQKWDVLIDVGHANANSWDLYRLISDLKDQIRGFHLHNNDRRNDLHNRIHNGTINLNRLLLFILEQVPDAAWVIEYTRPEYHGKPLLEDIESLMQYMK